MKQKFFLWLAIFLIFLSFSSFRRNGPNPGSRFILTKSLALYHQLEIPKQDVEFYSGLDYAIKDGKYYSDKPPGISFLILPFYFLGNFLSNYVELPMNDSFSSIADQNSFFLSIIFMSAINALGVLMIGETAKLLGANSKQAFWISIIFAFATIFWPYVSTLFSHALTATFLIFSLFFLFRYKKTNNSLDLIFSGFFTGVNITVDYTIILFVPIFLFYFLGLSFNLKKFILSSFKFLLPVAGFLLLLALYNILAFGGPFNFSYQFSTFKKTQRFDHPLVDGLYILLISPWRGLFFYNPILLIGIIGFCIFKSRLESLFFLSMFLIRLLFFSKYSYLTGGLCYGPRHLIPLIPLLILGLIPIFKRKNVSIKILVIILILLSFFHSFLGAYVNLMPYPETNKNPIYSIVLPQLIKGETQVVLIHPLILFNLFFSLNLIFYFALKKL